MQILPLTGDGFERSRLEAQQRSAGLQVGAGTLFWHTTFIHPITGQHALRVDTLGDKDYFTPEEEALLLSQEEAEEAGWFMDWEG